MTKIITATPDPIDAHNVATIAWQQAEIAWLLEALAKHGQHLATCPHLKRPRLHWWKPVSCTCGWDIAEATLKELQNRT